MGPVGSARPIGMPFQGAAHPGPEFRGRCPGVALGYHGFAFQANRRYRPPRNDRLLRYTRDLLPATHPVSVGLDTYTGGLLNLLPRRFRTARRLSSLNHSLPICVRSESAREKIPEEPSRVRRVLARPPSGRGGFFAWFLGLLRYTRDLLPTTHPVSVGLNKYAVYDRRPCTWIV